MDIPTELLVHQVSVKPVTGSNAYGETYGDPFPLRCFAEGGNRLVRAADGEQVVASLTVIASPGYASQVPPGSIITWRGREVTVISSTERDDGGLGGPQHAEIACT